MVEFHCPNCSQQMQAEERHRGAEVNCPTCSWLMGIPSGERDAIDMEHKGLRRIPFLLAMLTVLCVELLISVALGSGALGVAGSAVFALIGLCVAALPFASRLRNIGDNPWWSLGIFVPLLDVVIFFRCFVLPEDYAVTKRMDAPAWFISLSCIGIVIWGVVAIFAQ